MSLYFSYDQLYVRIGSAKILVFLKHEAFIVFAWAWNFAYLKLIGHLGDVWDQQVNSSVLPEYNLQQLKNINILAPHSRENI